MDLVTGKCMSPWFLVAVRSTVKMPAVRVDDLVILYIRIGFSKKENLALLAHNNHITIRLCHRLFSEGGTVVTYNSRDGRLCASPQEVWV